ncbi:SEL1-like repeat protein [Luteibacter sp. ME-Dv--P-043b]|jgi:TPR repeat protein|uniref:tetratricopeptide repeat protein n=1 Tax=unclassified Luteibacter TaxID=2620188 RepID=UPI002552B6E9|nr:SEL1-like repeat protein [Luteibacter sp. ME-Dv--P-043b]
MSEARGGSLLGDRRYAAEMDALQRFGRMEKEAQLGDPAAQFRVAQAYVDGTAHVTPDARRAAQWFRRAADQGHLDAQCRLAAHYADGLGVPHDPAEAAGWYRRAAEAGSAEAQCAMGSLHARGQGVATDRGESLRWWGLAADQGHVQACVNLGVSHYFGRGVPRDAELAFAYYSKAIDRGQSDARGYADALCSVAHMLCDGIGVACDPVMGARHYRRAAELGNASAQFALGRIYLETSHLDTDRDQARHWLGRAADQGDSEARRLLDEMDAAERQRAAAADAGAPRPAVAGAAQDAAAQFALGQRLAAGDGVGRNEPEAVRWLGLAAERGHTGAQYALARMIDGGRGVPRDVDAMLRWYRLAAGAGHADAQFELGLLHENGDGVPPSLAIARAWYRKAAARGHLKALRRLERRAWWRFWSP